MKTSITNNAITNGQIKQIKRFAEDAVKAIFIEEVITELSLSKDDGQHVVEHGDEFIQTIRNTVRTSLKELSVSKFADEEVSSNYGYLSGYKPNSLTEQTNRLRELFPGIGFANQDLLMQIEKGEIKLPQHTEGWFAIPNLMKNQNIFGSTYSEALQKILNVLKQTRNGNFYNYREGEIDEKHIRQSARTQKFFKELSDAQGNPDILIVPAQCGIRHRGRSVRRVREIFLVNECGLGSFAIGIMLLTHPERLQNYNDLWIDCAGDEFKSDYEASFSRAPLFLFLDDRLGFGAGGVSRAVGGYGSASAFSPQQ